MIASHIVTASGSERPIAWVEIIFRVEKAFPFKTLLRWSADQEAFQAPVPPIPEAFKAADLPPEPEDYGLGGNPGG